MAINDFYLDSLKELYIRCCNEINVEPGTFLKKTIGSTKNKIHNAIVKSRYEAGIYDPLAEALLDEGYIRSIDNRDDQFTITAKGMWIIEKEYYGQSVNDILDELDGRFFCSELEKITDKNKVVLFAAIAVHAFSENNSINYVNPGAEKAFLNMMRESFELLQKLKRIDIPSFESIINSNNNQKKSTALLTSNIDTLPRSTYSLFVSKKNCYYVELIGDDQKIDKNALKSLMKIIFGDIGVADIDTIMKSHKDISLNYGCYFHNDDTISYSEYCDAIEWSLTELAGF